MTRRVVWLGALAALTLVGCKRNVAQAQSNAEAATLLLEVRQICTPLGAAPTLARVAALEAISRSGR